MAHVLGRHIEMTSEWGRDSPLGATCQPDERGLRLAAADLVAVRDAAEGVAGRRGIHRFDDFVVCNEPRPVDQLRLMARGLAHKLRSALTGAVGRA
ncbi:hypothetical protein ABT025_04975 [Streptomyces sp. NPDC002809]|uniref:hypothetical protein n=1 Tax=Streptomyces sp. NPDC002809 TaxID=3154433 RepID=UPI0033250EA4